MDKVLELINKKVADHKSEIIKAGDFKEILKQKIIEGQLQLKDKSLKAGQTAMEILTLNEKISFHLACIKCLESLKQDLVNVP